MFSRSGFITRAAASLLGIPPAMSSFDYPDFGTPQALRGGGSGTQISNQFRLAAGANQQLVAIAAGQVFTLTYIVGDISIVTNAAGAIGDAFLTIRASKGFDGNSAALPFASFGVVSPLAAGQTLPFNVTGPLQFSGGATGQQLDYTLANNNLNTFDGGITVVGALV